MVVWVLDVGVGVAIVTGDGEGCAEGSRVAGGTVVMVSTWQAERSRVKTKNHFL